MSKIIAIGGTGQMVAYHYLQLYLLGVIQEPFDLVVIDTDDIAKGIRRIKAFIELLRVSEAQNNALGGAELPTITTLKIDAPEGNAFELLSGMKNLSGDHPVRAFFDRESGQQPLAKGLYARPALSSVVSRNQIGDALLMPAKDSMTVAVGSIIGGTSGGLLAPLVDRIRSLTYRLNIESRMRAVLFGQYFEPDEGRGIEAVRLQSNELLVMMTAKEALDKLDLYRIVGGPEAVRVKRLDWEKEKNAPWPDTDDHPVWEGVKSLDFLLTDTVMPFRDRFEDREVTVFKPRFSLTGARQRLRFALAMVRALVDHAVVNRMVNEPFLGFIWGNHLPDLVKHYWRIASKTAGGWDRVQDFPAKLQSQLATLWSGQGDEWGVGDVFPTLTALHAVKPGRVAKVQWPEVPSDAPWDKKQFTSAEDASRRAAAVLLFWSLRTGI